MIRKSGNRFSFGTNAGAFARRSLAADNQAFAGDNDPAAVLAADGVDPAGARHGIAGIDFVDTAPAFDQGDPVGNAAPYPSFHLRQPPHPQLGPLLPPWPPPNP